MKKMIRTRRIVTVIGCVCIYAAVGVSYAYAEGLISREDRPGWSQRYENFGRYDMRSYDENARKLDSSSLNPTDRGPAEYVTYDRLGNFLLPGDDAYNLTWDMSDVGAESGLLTTRSNIFNGLMITTEEFSSWQTRFMIGHSIRTYFTPSTFKRATFGTIAGNNNSAAIRWDASNRKNSFTFIANVGDKPSDDTDRVSDDSLFRNILGGHWQSVLGDVLKIGGTFVMENRGTSFYSNKDIDRTSKGLLDVESDRYIYVVITSDSPEDESISARVYDVQPVIDGKKTDLPMRVYKIPDIINMFKYSAGTFLNEYTFEISDSNLIPESIENYMYSNGSWFLDLMKDRDESDHFQQLFIKTSSASTIGYVNIVDPDNPLDNSGRLFESVAEQGYHEARGTDVIIYEVLIPAGARKVEFLVNAGNDYCIDIVACLPTMTEKVADPSFYDSPTEGWVGSTWSPFYETKHCVKASGRVNDNSNTDWVKISYDRVTGINVYGMNMEMDWRGLFIRAEINEYNVLRSYPINEYMSGASHKIESSRAWFINLEKDFGTWSVGGELFNYPNDYMEEWSSDFIDDNDDNDDVVRPTNNQEFPGLNFDYDGTPSTSSVDVTFRGDPYIGYYFDEVSYGDDFNHNGIIDERENDTEIDLPYERDSRGQHYFFKINPYKYSFISVGHYDIKQDVLGGRNLTNYIKFEHMQRIGNFEYGIFHRTERVKDNYKSDTYYWQVFGGPFLIGYNDWSGGDSYYGWEGTFNNFAYRDSWVNTSFLKTRITLFDGLNIINNVKYDAIDRLGDLTFEGSEQQKTMNVPRHISATAFVHKVDYQFRLADIRVIPDVYWHGIRILKERRIRELSFIPQFKFVNFYTTGNIHMRDGDNHIYNYYPVIRFDYQVAPRTKLRCAFQGIPGLMEVYRNKERPLEEENRRRMFVGFETLTLYSGFNILVTSGVRRDKRTFERQLGRREIGNTEYFITLNVESSG